MGKRPKRSEQEKQELATVGARLKSIANLKFSGSAMELVAATGISQPTWSRVLTGRQAPSWKLLVALIELGVNVEWVLTGRGYPFLEDSVQHRAGEQKFLVAKSILPGPPGQCREQLVGLDLHVDDLTRSRTRYWLQIQEGDPIVREDGMAIQAGDLIQLECDPSYWLDNLQRLQHAEIAAFRVRLGQADLLALGQIEVNLATPEQPLTVNANIFGAGKMPVGLNTAIMGHEVSESSRKAKAEFGKELRVIDLGGRLSSASGRLAEGEETRQGGQMAELIAVKVQLWRP